MPKLTAAQVAGVASNPPTGSTTAEWVAKARQENASFDTEKEDFLGSGHWGLWQISENHWNRSWNENVGSKENFVAQLKGANFNFRQAQFLYSDDRARGGNGWRPWIASGGKPTPTAADLAAAAHPDTSIGASGGDAGDLGVAEPGLGLPNPLDPIAEVADALKDGVQTIKNAFGWITTLDNIKRVLWVIGGLALGLIALSIVAKPVVADVAQTVKPV